MPIISAKRSAEIRKLCLMQVKYAIIEHECNLGYELKFYLLRNWQHLFNLKIIN